MQCLFYDQKIKKIIPCLLKKDEFHLAETSFMKKKYIVHVSFDDTKYTEYNTDRGELMRYSSEFIAINDLYPATTQAEIDYAKSVIPKHFPTLTTGHLTTGTTHNTDELDRFKKLVDMLTDQTSISQENFYKLFEFINYELFFTYCDQTERDFLTSLSDTQLTSQPSTVEVPQMVLMNRRIFDKFANTFTDWKIVNYNQLSEFENDMPFRISITNLEYNVNYITGI